MATPVERRLVPTHSRRFGSGRESHVTPDLTKIQTKSYAAFLQAEVNSLSRKDHGMEGVLREIFPIESYDKQVKLEYIKYAITIPTKPSMLEPSATRILKPGSAPASIAAPCP